MRACLVAARRFFFFFSAWPLLFVTLGWSTNRFFYFIEWWFYREALCHLDSVRRTARGLVFACLVRGACAAAAPHRGGRAAYAWPEQLPRHARSCCLGLSCASGWRGAPSKAAPMPARTRRCDGSTRPGFAATFAAVFAVAFAAAFAPPGAAAYSAVVKGFSTFSATVLALTFVFGNSLRQMYEAMLFLFVEVRA